MLQFWNLLNAKAFSTHKSAFSGLSRCYGVLLVLLFILIGQWLIVQFGGRVFRTEPLMLADWCRIMAITSAVLWIGEIQRLIQKLCRKKKN